MFEKDLTVALLLDFYGEVLSPRSRSMMEAYYCDDLSLAEIAESEGVSRQAVRHALKKSEGQLLFLEEKLGLAEGLAALKDTAAEMTALADALAKRSKDLPDGAALAALAERMKRTSDRLLGKENTEEEHRVSKPDR